MPKRILVTGGAGFLGSHLCDRMLHEGNEVLCVDNFTTGTNHNIHHHQDNNSFALLRHDVTHPLDVDVTEIYNFACPASPTHYRADPIRTMETSILGSINLLKLAKRVGAPILQASSSEVYGDPQAHPQSEDYWGHVNPIGLRACYNEGKRCAETLFTDYARQHDLPARIARIFNTYGPRMHPNDGRVIPTFIVQALKGDDLSVHGSGDQTRSFCYVDDLVEGVVRMMATRSGVTGPLNLGNPTEVSIRHLAELVIDLTGSKSTITHLPRPSDDPQRRQPDISRAKAQLGWEPIVPLREGLVRTIAYLDEFLSGR